MKACSEYPTENTIWKRLIKREKLSSHKEHMFISLLKESIMFVKLVMYPDGGISRLRIIGTPVL